MVDALTIFAIAVSYFLGMLGVRMGIFRGIILELQKKAEERSKEAYTKFEAVIFASKKKDRNPEQALNNAAQYLSWERIIDNLNGLYRSNWSQISILDIFGVILTALYIMFDYPPNSPIQPIHFIVIIGLGIISGTYLIISIIVINRIEKKLGVGVVQHRFNFFSRSQD